MDKKYQKRIFNGKILSKHKFSGLTLVTLRAFFCMRRCPFLRCAGFTLLELLVVVLIIGILAAVAVPQYQKAVLSSRSAQLEMWAGELKKSIQNYMMANGKNTLYFEDLDIYSEQKFPIREPSDSGCAAYGNFKTGDGANDFYISFCYGPRVVFAVGEYKDLGFGICDWNTENARICGLANACKSGVSDSAAKKWRSVLESKGYKTVTGNYGCYLWMAK